MQVIRLDSCLAVTASAVAGPFVVRLPPLSPVAAWRHELAGTYGPGIALARSLPNTVPIIHTVARLRRIAGTVDLATPTRLPLLCPGALERWCILGA